MRMAWFVISQTTAAAALAIAGYSLSKANEPPRPVPERIELAGTKGKRAVLDGDGLTFSRDGDEHRVRVDLVGLDVRVDSGAARVDSDGVHVTDTRQRASFGAGALRIEGLGGSIFADATHDDVTIGVAVTERAAVGQGMASALLRADQKTAGVMLSRLPAAGGDLSAHVGVFGDKATLDVRAGAAVKQLEVSR